MRKSFRSLLKHLSVRCFEENAPYFAAISSWPVFRDLIVHQVWTAGHGIFLLMLQGTWAGIKQISAAIKMSLDTIHILKPEQQNFHCLWLYAVFCTCAILQLPRQHSQRKLLYLISTTSWRSFHFRLWAWSRVLLRHCMLEKMVCFCSFQFSQVNNFLSIVVWLN